MIRASQTGSRDLAVFIRHRAEMLADYHRRVEPFANFVEVRGVPLNRTRAGKVVAIVPFDQLVWTKQARDLVSVIDQDIRERQLGTSIDIRIAGTATALAREGLRERGWNVVENISPLAPHPRHRFGATTSRVFQPLEAGSQAVLVPGLKRHIRPVERIGLDKSLSIRTTARRREGGRRLEDLAADDNEADPPWAREAVALAASSTHSSP